MQEQPNVQEKSEDNPAHSGAQFTTMPVMAPKPARSLVIPRTGLIIIGAVLLVGLSFFGGVAYQKGKGTTNAPNGTLTAANGQNGGFGGGGLRGGGGQRVGGFGTVTAVSSSSITVAERSFGPQSSGDSTSKTYSITSATTITDNGTTASASDIQTGDTVMIRTASSTSTVASEIRISSQTGGAPDSSQQSSDAPTTSTETSTI